VAAVEEETAQASAASAAEATGPIAAEGSSVEDATTATAHRRRIQRRRQSPRRLPPHKVPLGASLRLPDEPNLPRQPCRKPPKANPSQRDHRMIIKWRRFLEDSAPFCWEGVEQVINYLT
jgi:hypothetical protein